jgi:hypothetical protein
MDRFRDEELGPQQRCGHHGTAGLVSRFRSQCQETHYHAVPFNAECQNNLKRSNTFRPKPCTMDACPGGLSVCVVTDLSLIRPRALEGQGARSLPIPSLLQVRNFVMPSAKKPEVLDPSQQRARALARWDNEGGAIAGAPQASAEQSPVPELTNAELVHLRVRVIALENLVISLLAGVTDRQIDLTREMAAYISPRPGFTQHPLTIHAASQMIDLVERAGQFRDPPPKAVP